MVCICLAAGAAFVSACGQVLSEALGCTCFLAHSPSLSKEVHSEAATVAMVGERTGSEAEILL